MGITLRVLTGAAAGRKFHLTNGQLARFGRTEWADYSFPDEAMGDIHFAIECTGSKCLLRDLGTESGTFVGGNAVVEIQLHSGDEVMAGRTVFLVTIDGESASDQLASRRTVPVVEAVRPLVPSEVIPRSLVETCKYLEFEDTVCDLAQTQNAEPSAFIRTLADHRMFIPALRLMAHQLPRHEAVWWGSLCTRESLAGQLTAQDLAALDAADEWVKTGNETDRRRAEIAAAATNFAAAAAWVALGAFWAEGSLAPADMPEIAPDERLTPQAIVGVLLMVAAKAPPGQADAQYKRFLEIADEIASGKNPVPRIKRGH